MKPKRALLTVSRAATLSGLTVRTLHHYDRLRLVEPSARSRAGYRLYTQDDLARLQQVLFFRELGFALDDIRRIMASSSFDRRRALAAQRALLGEKGERIRAMLAAIDRALAAHGERTMDKQDFEMFGGFDPGRYEEEARKRWGHTQAFKTAAVRTVVYTKAQWEAITSESDAITNAFAANLRAGHPADHRLVVALAERHRQHIDRWYYPCPPAMHANLGRMYADDDRLAANYEAVEPGLAAYVRDAIVANAERSAPPDPHGPAQDADDERRCR